MFRHRSPGPGAGGRPGWGGPARGAGRGGPARPFSSTYQPSRESRQRRSAGERAERRAQRDARADALEHMLYELAMSAEREEAQLAAACRLHDILAGPPVKRAIAVTTEPEELSEAELAERIRV